LGSAGSTVKVTLTDSTGKSVNSSKLVGSNGSWEISSWDVSSLGDGDIQITAQQTNKTETSTVVTQTIVKNLTMPSILSVNQPDAITTQNSGDYTVCSIANQKNPFN
jgi:hypothetical protein